MIEFKPEEQVEIILWDWLKTKGSFVKEIYFNRKNKINAPIFNTKGEKSEKPDLLINIDRGYGSEFIAVEVKDNSKRKDILDAHKIMRYHSNYRLGFTKYFVNDIEIKISYFLIATINSLKGHLFNLDDEGKMINNLLESGNDQWKKTLAKYGQEPKFEYAGTAQNQRTLFSMFREERKKFDNEKAPAIGILISEIINDKGEVNELPFMFIMNYNDYNSNFKKRWGCRFWKI